MSIDPNSEVVGVDIISGAGNDPGAPPDPPAADVFDPSGHTVDEVLAYLDEHNDETERVLERERAGKNRASLVG